MQVSCLTGASVHNLEGLSLIMIVQKAGGWASAQQLNPNTESEHPAHQPFTNHISQPQTVRNLKTKLPNLIQSWKETCLHGLNFMMVFRSISLLQKKDFAMYFA